MQFAPANHGSRETELARSIERVLRERFGCAVSLIASHPLRITVNVHTTHLTVYTFSLIRAASASRVYSWLSPVQPAHGKSPIIVTVQQTATANSAAAALRNFYSFPATSVAAAKLH
ncbi:MAG: hypothetical protein L0Y58_01490 [Verrucomicrobia subdivision 3 bacterium]|nr:hypothetical protein [Limisphaerales bacterium]